MSNKFEVIVAWAGPVGAAGGAASGSALIYDQVATDMNGFTLVNQNTQLGASVASVLSVVKMTAGAIPYLNSVTNTVAGTTVIMKMTIDAKSTEGIQPGDIASLVGNVAGVVGAIAFFAGAPALGLGMTAVGVVAAIVGVSNSELGKNIKEKILQPLVDRYFSKDSSPQGDRWIAPDLSLVTSEDLQSKHNGEVAAIAWNPDNNEVDVISYPIKDDNAGPGSGAGGGPVDQAAGTPDNTSDSASPTGELHGSLGGMGAPENATPGPLPDAHIDISIESIGPVTSKPPEATPTPTAEVPPQPSESEPAGPPKPESPQDNYGCCSGSQDSYS